MASNSSQDSKLIRAHLQKAERRLVRARRDLADGFYEDAVIRAYYAIFHAAKALLASAGSFPRTHEGLVAEFGRLFVRTGKLDGSYGRIISAAKVLRERGEYEPFTRISKAEACHRVREASKFVRKVKRLRR